MRRPLQAGLASGPSWSCCQRCQQHTECPFAFDQMIRQSALQGHVAAQVIASEARKQKSTAEATTSVETLLAQDHALLCMLSQMMEQELKCSEPLFLSEVFCS